MKDIVVGPVTHDELVQEPTHSTGWIELPPPPRSTFAQVGRLLALQAEAGVMSDIPETEQEAQARIEELESLSRYRDDWRWRVQLQSTSAPRWKVRAA